MIKINTLIKVSVAMLLMGAIFSTAQAAELTLTASVSSNVVVSVASPSSSIVSVPDVDVPVTGNMEVKANKAGWTVAIKSTTDDGLLRSTTDNFEQPLKVSVAGITGIADAVTVSTPITTTGQIMLRGIAHTQGPKTTTVTYTQPGDWLVDPLNGPYSITLTFIATPGP
jgi:hypothetical protein